MYSCIQAAERESLGSISMPQGPTRGQPPGFTLWICHGDEGNDRFGDDGKEQADGEPGHPSSQLLAELDKLCLQLGTATPLLPVPPAHSFPSPRAPSHTPQPHEPGQLFQSEQIYLKFSWEMGSSLLQCRRWKWSHHRRLFLFTTLGI